MPQPDICRETHKFKLPDRLCGRWVRIRDTGLFDGSRRSSVLALLLQIRAVSLEQLRLVFPSQRDLACFRVIHLGTYQIRYNLEDSGNSSGRIVSVFLSFHLPNLKWPVCLVPMARDLRGRI